MRLVTRTTFSLARSLVGSLTHDMSARDERIRELIDVELIPFREAVERAFTMIAQNQVRSSWIDSLSSGRMEAHRLREIEVPQHGVLTDRRELPFDRDPEEVAENIWRLGGGEGWYAMDWAWHLRGWLDRLVGLACSSALSPFRIQQHGARACEPPSRLGSGKQEKRWRRQRHPLSLGCD